MIYAGSTSTDIQEALNFAAANVRAMGDPTLPSGGCPVVALPPGRYLFTGPVTVPDYARIVGDGAVLYATDPSVDFFTSVGYQAHFEGLRFRGGRTHISIATNNVASSVVNIDDCQHHNPSRAAVEITDNSASTLVNISRARLSGLASDARFLLMGSGDKVVVERSWWQGHADYFVEQTGGWLECSSILGNPSAVTGAWFKMSGNSSLLIDCMRFGGERGGKTMVECHTGPDITYPVLPRQLSIRRSQCYAAEKYALVFHDMPNVVDIDGCHGFVGSDGAWFDPAMPSSSKSLGGNGAWRFGRTVVPLLFAGDETVIANLSLT